ncbi:hypothetical protein [Ferrovibrio sp.]|uniref:hypothetical protein n=1 Tax=Ferrovibrio sp. TaxID=1917215 RepID=UPI001B72CD28|nr:hypothetical protein [Ferrovibrio sp.]MBP7064274.1 hypothetical protein [Ferrovibrio sp.]
MPRLLVTALIAAACGLGGAYGGTFWAKQEIMATLQAEQQARFQQQDTYLLSQSARLAEYDAQISEVARRTMTLINGLTSLAVDSEIVAAEIADLRNRVDRMEVMRGRMR